MSEDERPHTDRVLLKLSGEILAGRKARGIDSGMVDDLSRSILRLSSEECRVGIVIGGGNFVRGRELTSVNFITADQMGMLATMINGLALRDSLRQLGGTAVILSSIPVEGIFETFSPEKASDYLDRDFVVIYAGGTGNPCLTTDTAAALRAVQTGCSRLLKGTKVDGVYDSDPMQNPDAKRFANLSFEDVLKQDLRFMDASAIAICRDAGLPISVFDIWNPDNIVNVFRDPSIGSWIGGTGNDK